MNSKFVRLYLRFVAIVLSLTALAKLPAIPTIANKCMEDPMFGRFQPFPNGELLALAAGTEFVIVGLIFSVRGAGCRVLLRRFGAPFALSRESIL